MNLKKIFSMLLGVLMVFAISIANGTILTVDASYSLVANPDFGISSNMYDAQTQTNNTSASVSVGASYGSGSGAVGATSYADNSGVIGTGAGGVEQYFYSSASAKSSTSITNNTGGDVNYFYTLNIPNSGVQFYSNYFGNGDSFYALNQFAVNLNGIAIWDSFASISLVANSDTTGVLNFATGGVALPWVASNNYTDLTASINHPLQVGSNNDSALTLSGYTAVIDLGILGSGQSFILDYILNSQVSVNAPSSCGYECFAISAYIGDPSGLNSAPVLGSVIGESVTDVPIPGTAWLMLVGFLGLVSITRRKIV
jgi:hypothetical protein